MLLAENVTATDDYTIDFILKRPIQSRVVRVERQAGILLLDGALRWTPDNHLSQRHAQTDSL